MLFGPPGLFYLGSLRAVIFKLCSIFELAFCGEAAALVLSSSPSVVGCLHVSEGVFQRYVSEVCFRGMFYEIESVVSQATLSKVRALIRKPLRSGQGP